MESINHIDMKRKRRSLRARLVRKCSMEEVRLEFGNMNKKFINR